MAPAASVVRAESGIVEVERFAGRILQLTVIRMVTGLAVAPVFRMAEQILERIGRQNEAACRFFSVRILVEYEPRRPQYDAR